MPDPFEDARRKLARADQLFAELEEAVKKYSEAQPLEKIEVSHPAKPDHILHKVVVKDPLPNSVADLAGDIVNNLRSALDIATYTLAVKSGCEKPKNCAFPFAGSLAQMANSLGRSKDLPLPIQSLFVGLQPYLGGDDILWALNEMCNTDKHKMILPVGTALIRTGANVGGTGFFSMPDPHVWNRDTQEMELITLGPGAKFEYYFELYAWVAVNGIRVVDGKSILEVILKMGNRVLDILNVLESESRRLGYIA